MQDTSLHAPRAESIDLSTLADGYRQVLMPGHLPIRPLSLVKQYSPDSEAFRSENRANDFPNGLRCCKVTDDRDRQEISFCVLSVSEAVLKAFHNSFVEATGNDCKANLLYAPRRVSHYGNCASNVRRSEYDTEASFRESRFTGLVRRFNPMGDLEKILPDEIRGSTLWPGNELVLPHAEASSAVGIATEHQIAILGFEAFEVRKDGLLTVDLNDPSAHISFAGDWLAYVVAMNTEADHWIKEHRYGANHGYILTSASKSEFDQIQKLRKTL